MLLYVNLQDGEPQAACAEPRELLQGSYYGETHTALSCPFSTPRAAKESIDSTRAADKVRARRIADNPNRAVN
jgi:hypothetical protein